MTLQIKTGKEPFTSHGVALNFNLEDFWRWIRPVELIKSLAPERLAEFLVAKSLSIPKYELADNPNGFELVTVSGIKLEVKFAIFERSPTRKSSKGLRFNAAEAFDRPASQRCFDRSPKKHPDVFIFSFVTHDKNEPLQALDLDRWSFCVFSAQGLIDRKEAGRMGDHIDINAMRGLGSEPIDFRALSYAIIDTALGADFTRLVEHQGAYVLAVGLPEQFASTVSPLTWFPVEEWSSRPGPETIRLARAKILSNPQYFLQCSSCGVRHNRGFFDSKLRCLFCVRSGHV